MDLVVPIAGGICGSLCWILIRPFVDGALVSTLDETALWDFTYALGFVLPFFVVRLWSLQEAAEVKGRQMSQKVVRFDNS